MRHSKNMDVIALTSSLSIEAAQAINKIKKHINSLPIDKKPKVCIRCITYNHGNYIREALDSFIMQKTNFPFVAVVHDDASTDNTAEIVREYAEKYPDIIFPIFETENQYSKPGGPLTKIMQVALDATGAKYIAMCEGDDYWTDSNKLQKQVDFLDAHPDYVMCSHNHSTLDQNSGIIRQDYFDNSQTYDIESYIYSKSWIYRTLTIMYCKDALDANVYIKYPDRRDMVLFYHLLTHGKGYYFENNMGVYRLHGGGVWSSITSCTETLYIKEHTGRLGIYNIENTANAAQYLMNSFSIAYCGRMFLLKHPKLLLETFTPYIKHFGILKAIKVFINRIFLNHIGC